MNKYFLVLILVLQAIVTNAVPRALTPRSPDHSIHFSRQPLTSFREIIHRPREGNNQKVLEILLIVSLLMAALSTFTAFATPLLLFLAPVIAPYSWLGIFLVVLGMTTGLIAMISGLILLFLKNGKRVRIVGGIIGIVIGFLGFWEELKIRKLL